MNKHITRQHLNAYVDKTLPMQERRAVYMHLCECAQCDAKLRAEEDVRAGMQQINGLGKRRDFSSMLPGILAKAQTPAGFTINKTALVLAVLIAVAILVPLLPITNLGSFTPNSDSILNVPLATQTLTIQERVTIESAAVREQTPESQSAQPLQVSFNVEYASPVPPPRATRIASVEPPR